MSFEIVPAHELLSAEQAAIFTEAFAGYLAGSITMDTAGFARLLSAQSIDLCFSRFIRSNTKLAGFGYINRTGNISRLAGMGVVPSARRTGAAAYLLSHLLKEAKARGDEAMMLETFEQNTPAHSLYRRFGFRELTRLFGWRRKRDAAISTVQEPNEISLLTAVRLPSAFEYPAIPWQISRYAVAKLTGARAFCLDNACVVIGNPDLSPTRIHAFLGQDASNWSSVKNVMAAALKRFPESEFFAPPIFPEQFGIEIFEPLGFKREPLNQFLMRCDW